MNEFEPQMTQEIAQVAIAYQTERTGHAPASVTVVLSEETLVITLHDALTPAEKALALNPAGAAQVQDFHRQLFLSSASSLRKEIARITGRNVREATAEIEPATGAVVHAFTTGNLVQVFRLNGRAPTGAIAGNAAKIGCDCIDGRFERTRASDRGRDRWWKSETGFHGGQRHDHSSRGSVGASAPGIRRKHP
jgi:uncharacterized protein YbcI